MSDVWVLLRGRARASLSRQRVLLGLVAAVIAAVLTVSAVLAAGLSYYAENVRTQSALTLIEVSSAAASARRTVDEPALKEIAGLPHVRAVHPWAQTDLGLADEATWPQAATNPNPLWATAYVPGLAPRVIAGDLPAAGPRLGEVALPHHVPGGELTGLLGRTVSFEYTQVTTNNIGQPVRIDLRVIAIVANDVPDRDGQTPAYVSWQQLVTLVANSGTRSLAEIPTAFVQVDEAANVAAVQATLADRGFAVSSLASQVPSLGGLFEVLAASQTVAAALLLVSALALGSALGAAWIGARRREIGLLKALGWSSSRVGVAVLAECFGLGLCAALAGVLVGCGAALLATTAVAAARIETLPLSPWSLPSPQMVALALIAVPACVALGGGLAACRAASADPDAALRDL